MTTGISSQGTGLENLLAVRTTGWPEVAATNIAANGVDINTLFAPVSSGSAGPNLGIKSAGIDIGTIFAQRGTTAVSVTSISAVTGSTAAGTPSGTVTSNSTSVTASKGKGSYTYTWTIASGSGITFTGQGTASTAISATVSESSSNTGTFYCAVSDGTTTTNTNTVSWSLSNTSVTGYSISMTLPAAAINGTDYGWEAADLGGFGSISPTTINGQNPAYFYWRSTGHTLYFGLYGNISQTIFSTVSFTGVTGAQSLNFASASYAYNSGQGITVWSWTSLSTQPFNPSGTYTITFS
jgi:hypothetical protein